MTNLQTKIELKKMKTGYILLKDGIYTTSSGKKIMLEVGKEYKIEDIKHEIVFYIYDDVDKIHFSRAENVTEIVVEVEDLDGNSIGRGYGQTETTHIKVLRVVPHDEFKLHKFDENGRVVKTPDWEGKYDDEGNLIYSKELDGLEEERTFDPVTRTHTLKDKTGFWTRQVFNEDDQRLIYENSYGIIVKDEYDDMGNHVKHYHNKDGSWEKKFDNNGNVIYFSNEYQTREIEYNKHGLETGRCDKSKEGKVYEEWKLIVK